MTSNVIEVEVHSSLRAFLREQNQPSWPHHLTMARLVARALRLGRPALIQTGTDQKRYSISYLTPALLGHWPVIIVAPDHVQQQLVQESIPQLQQWLETEKEIIRGDRIPNPNFQGILLTSPASWLADRLENGGRFPKNLPTIITQADDLEEWTRKQLTVSLRPEDWEEMMQKFPHQADLIRDLRVRLTKAIFEHPQNPYECYLLEAPEIESLQHLFTVLDPNPVETRNFASLSRNSPSQMIWASIAREQGQFTLHSAPVEVASALSPVWQQQPFVLIGGFLDEDTKATVYRQKLGLGDLTCLKFSPDRQNECIQLYIPERLPLPNTAQYRSALIQQVRTLISLRSNVTQPIVLLIDDVPLKAQVGATIAAEFWLTG